MPEISFVKMQGLGNDFMVVDTFKQKFDPHPEIIKKLANRHFGVGFDQLLLIQPSENDHIDFIYRIFNADGNEVAQCGNGARCLAVYVRAQGLSSKDQLIVQTLAGEIELTLRQDGQVLSKLGIPIFIPEQIPFIAPAQLPSYALSTLLGSLEVGAVSIGNPHCVVQVPDITTAPVQKLGEVISQHERFPQSVNVGFMEILSPEEIRLRVYERGVGETLACGSGACAAVAYGRVQQLLAERVTVHLPGGIATVYWPDATKAIYLIGPAEKVYIGNVEI